MHRKRTLIGLRGALAAAAAISLPALAQPLQTQVTSSVPIAGTAAAAKPAASQTVTARSAAMQPTVGQESAFQADAIRATAVRALRWAFYARNGYRWEYSGILLRRNGELGYSEFPRTLKKVDSVEMDPSKQKAPGDMLVALYHTHPCNPREYFPQYFSPQDLISAFFYHVPTFILDECTGDVHEFDPAIDQARDTGVVVEIKTKSGRSRRVRLPAGRIVGNIGDRGPDLSLIESLTQQTTY